jgi:L-malate glycosyltransferase
MPTIVSVFGVEPKRIGGTEMFARELSQQLGERGWRSVACFLSEPTEEVRAFLDLHNISLEVIDGPLNGSLKSLKSLNEILRRHRPEILHLHYTSFLSLYPWLARIRSVRKIFFTDHHSRPAGYVPKREPFWKRAIARLVNLPLTKVFSVSNYGYRCMTSLCLLPRERFEMIYNAVDLSRVCDEAQRGVDFRKRYAIPADRAIVTQVSWMIPEKGIDDVLRTARLVIAQYPRVQFVLVGDGAHREMYTKQAEAMGIGDHVTWTGAVADPFGEGVFAAADVVCQFSRWEEVFGWMIAEAMAHGKPVVATRVGGIPELIDDGVSGCLINRGDIQAMSKTVLMLLNDPELRARMGKSARQKVSTTFELRANVQKLIRLYGVSLFVKVANEIPRGVVERTENSSSFSVSSLLSID